MKIKNLGAFLGIFLLTNFLFSITLYAQSGVASANSWISYGKPYLKIAVSQKGLHKLPLALLPTEFSTSQPDKIQLWHRGKQIAIISIDNNEIIFYGVPNDGSTDSLLYRPMSSRLNPYYSFYSDESSYFLVIGDSAGLRSQVISQSADNTIPLLTNNLFKLSTQFGDEYSLSTTKPIRPAFFNSFFEIGASETGKITLVGKLAVSPFSLSKLDTVSTSNPQIEFLMHGRSNNSRSIEVYAGKDEQSLRLVQTLSNSGFAGTKYSFNLKAGDIDKSGNGVLALKSVSADKLDRFSLSYYDVYYPQLFNMKGEMSHEFGLAATSLSWSRINIENTPANVKVIDITDVDKPKVISGALNNLMVSRTSGKALNLLATNEYVTLASTKLSKIQFTSFDPKSSNYLIVTSENLITGAGNYAAYRFSKEGGNFKPLVANIKDIYNQFNYGEPSPIAIRRFVEYMVSDGNKEKYLFLIGKAITFNERMVKELPDEVPSIGLPASDILLVEGLAGTPRDVPTIPVGRLSALSNQHILDYLQKVKEYELAEVQDLGWRKNILHLNGGKTADEISQLKGLLADLVPVVNNGVLGGEVTPFVKQQGIAEVETVNITPEVNNGVGLITYFGHGATNVTDLDMGYSTDAARGYNNSGKYPMMYFNGCGVGNIFSALFNPNPNTSDRYPLSMDWLLAPKKGAIAIIANSFESFVGPSSQYLDQLYLNMFSDPATVNLSIGKIQSAVAGKIVSNDANTYNVANIHQSVLQGDPSLKLVTVSHSDYAIDSDQGIYIYSESASKTIENSGTLKVKVVVANLGRFVKEEKIPVLITYYYKDGNVEDKETIAAIAYSDTLSFNIENKRIIQRIEVEIDPAATIVELSKKNNTAELLIDWDAAKTQQVYPIGGSNKDVVPPILKVEFNNRSVTNDEIFAPNPSLKFVLQDDRLLLIDTTYVNVFIKPCGDDNCDYKRLSYYSGELVLSELTSRSIQINYTPKTWNTGIYELLVIGKDQAGNSSINPYSIRFSIETDGDANVKVIASPNPASTYVRFETKVRDSKSIESIKYAVYDLSGRLIFNKQIDGSQSETNELYWYPYLVSSGLYVYKITVNQIDKTNKQVTGKLVLTN